jgi:integrase
MKFTDKYIQSLKPESKRYELREGGGDGFAIRCAPSGKKSWLYFYHFEGKKRRMTLGEYPVVCLAEARKRHRDAMTALMTHGKDQASALMQQKLTDRTALTVNFLAAEYLEKWAKPRKRSWREDERILKKDILPSIGKMKVQNVEKRNILLILDRISERGAPIAANRTLAVARRMFNFAVERDIIKVSPCYMMKLPSKENKRDRVLSEEEIRAFWQGLDNAKMTDLSRIALRFQLVTAQRKGEIVSAEWKEFDLKKGWWEIPAEKAKNGNLHRVPLSKLAMKLLQQLKEISESDSWVFPSPKAGQHIAGMGVDHALRNNLSCFENVEKFTPHDLRRTAASQMTALGIARLVVSKLLNHAENSVTAIYDRHSYDKEKKEALDLWGEKLADIVS